MRLALDNILVPTDFSAAANVAIDHALALARRSDARLTLLHVLLGPDTEPYELMSHVPDLATVFQRQEASAQEALTSVREQHDTEGVAIDACLVRASDIVSGIEKKVDEIQADLVVMGAHGRRGFRRFLLGSIAEETLRSVPCSVWTVRETAKPISGLSRIVVPIDFSEHARIALVAARHFAGPTMQLDLVHVIEHPVAPRTDVPWPYPMPELQGAELVTMAEEAMVRFAEMVSGPDVPSRIHVLEGSVAESIVALAKTCEDALIMIATHGLTGLAHLLIGSVAERVVRSAECPVLTLKTQREKASAADVA